jgi:hypothetical protein
MVQRREKGLEEKAAEIAKWIDPHHRTPYKFHAQRHHSAEHTGCTEHLVSLSLDTAVPHIRQHISLPLNSVEVAEDVSHYTRDPQRPLQRKRMMLIVQGNRPAVIY